MQPHPIAAEPSLVERRWHCDGELVLEGGTAKFGQNRTESGALLDQSIAWLPNSDAAKKTGMRMQWENRVPEILNWDNGFIAFDRTTDETSVSMKTRRRVVMELRASDTQYFESVASLRNPEDAEVGGHFAAELADVAAMARGSQRLYLLSRDRSGKVLETVEIDSSSFVAPTEQLNERLEEMNRDTAPLHLRCTDLSAILI